MPEMALPSGVPLQGPPTTPKDPPAASCPFLSHPFQVFTREVSRLCVGGADMCVRIAVLRLGACTRMDLRRCLQVHARRRSAFVSSPVLSLKLSASALF
eukprot:942969-Amphidinium_carterae.1